MYHLTRYRYIFFAISGIVLVPGILALIFWHLNLGIDFTGGSTIDLRFQSNNVTVQQVQEAFQQDKGQDVAVFVSKDLNDKLAPSHFVYVQFSRPIDTNESNAVIQRLQDPKYGLPQVDTTATTTIYSSVYPGSSQPTALMVVSFKQANVDLNKVKTALANLPPTGVPVGASSSSSASGTATPAASPTTSATPAATATASPTATATSTPTTATTTFPVNVTNIQASENSQIYEVQTQTQYDGTAAQAILSKLMDKTGPAYVEQNSNVGPSIAGDTTRSAFLAVVLAAVAILFYIAIAFHKVGSFQLSLRFGASAIIALLHDAFVVLGLWAIFGRLFNFKVDTLFLTAVLTVIGFSVHDTIVVFDRIRENLGRRTSESFDTVVDTSLIQTMSRSLNTSLTVLFTLAALTLFGGDSIREFTLALLIGIASGTYSSIFNASMILSVWQNKEYRHWFRRGGAKGKAPSRPRELTTTRA